jgi:repressor LexA
MDVSRKELTERQEKVLNFIQHYMQHNGYPPTIVEMCREFNFSSTNAATQFLVALERKGYIKRSAKGASRGIQILDEQRKPIVPASPAPETPSYSPFHTPTTTTASPTTQRPLPDHIKNVVIIGEGHSANPLSVFLSPQGQIKVDTEFFVDSKDAALSLFAAVVSDDALGSEGLRTGDLVLARQQFSASVGDVVVVQVREQTLVRRLIHNGSAYWLSTTNSAVAPLPYNGNDASTAVLGVVVGMMRKLGKH